MTVSSELPQSLPIHPTSKAQSQGTSGICFHVCLRSGIGTPQGEKASLSHLSGMEVEAEMYLPPPLRPPGKVESGGPVEGNIFWGGNGEKALQLSP